MSEELEAKVRRSTVWPSVAAALAVLTVVLSVFWDGAARGATGTTQGMDPTLVERLRSNGIIVEPLQSDAGAISASDAVAAAGEAGSGDQSVHGVSALVSFTDTAYGPADGKGGISPLFVDVPAWAVVFAGVETPLLGPSDIADAYYKADLVVFLDARTGEYLNAISFAANY